MLEPGDEADLLLLGAAFLVAIMPSWLLWQQGDHP